MLEKNEIKVPIFEQNFCRQARCRNQSRRFIEFPVAVDRSAMMEREHVLESRAMCET